MKIDTFKYCKMRLREAANKTLLHMAGLNCIKQVMLIHYIYIYIYINIDKK